MGLVLNIRVTLRFVGGPVGNSRAISLSFQICKWTPTNPIRYIYQSIGNKTPKCTKVSNGIQLIYNAGGWYVYLSVLITRLSNKN